MGRPKTANRVQLPLRARITCPHCWHIFPPGDVLWVSAHPDLQGDSRLGADAQQRFLPTRFTVDGLAVDVKGVTCKQLACPKCHLTVPRAFLEMPPLFVSTLGAPGSGKSYFLASMTWQLRQTLGEHFHVNFTDADPEANRILNEYEETLFLNPDEDQLVRLRKTETDGELYDSVQDGERQVWYPRPFVFSMQSERPDLDPEQRKKLARALCLYDNAGEHFMPGGQSDSSPVTQHLALSRVLLFLFDPTQHPRFRKACQDKTADPQMGKHGWSHRQDHVLSEAAKRIRSQTGLAQSEKYSRPLIVVVTKYDAWAGLAKGNSLDPNWVIKPAAHGAGLDIEKLRQLSTQVRSILQKHAPEVVSAAEGFSEDVTYIPVSALGRNPEVDPQTGELKIRPRDIAPQFVEVPLLYALHRAVDGVVSAAWVKGAKVREALRTKPQNRPAVPPLGGLPAGGSSIGGSSMGGSPGGSNLGGSPGGSGYAPSPPAEQGPAPRAVPGRSSRETYLAEPPDDSEPPEASNGKHRTGGVDIGSLLESAGEGDGYP